MKRNSLITSMISIVLFLFMSLIASSAAMGAQGGGGGQGGGGAGGGMESPDFGDLFVLYRDADGIPILTDESCQQPLAAPGVALPAVGSIPACVPAPEQSCIIPVDPATCSVVLGYETFTQEVEFGRTNEARSPASVFETQLEEAVIRLSTADCVTLDPAGRMVTSTVTDTVVTSAAIDSPLQNLAIYRQLMLTGFLGAASAPLQLPSDILNTAARAIGAASDKTGKVNVDMVIYLNQILGLTDETVTTFLPKKCIEVREEVKGVVQMVSKCFLDYGAYAYNRASNFGSLPSPAYIPAGAAQSGWFEYLAILDPSILSFQILEGPILNAVPELLASFNLAASNIGGFAQAADDTRAVIDFMHSWPVPADYATPLSCTASGVTTYDVSISEESGLQVPVRMVAGTEGREFTLTVSNAGPDAATGTVLLTAKDATGNSIATFPRTYSFTLIPGTSKSWTEGFSVSYATTIAWTATAQTPPTLDVNPNNDSVAETTTVTGRGGGQSGGQ